MVQVGVVQVEEILEPIFVILGRIHRNIRTRFLPWSSFQEKNIFYIWWKFASTFLNAKKMITLVIEYKYKKVLPNYMQILIKVLLNINISFNSSLVDHENIFFDSIACVTRKLLLSFFLFTLILYFFFIFSGLPLNPL